MKEYELKYGCNPNQKPARVFMENGADLPMEILNGRPGYINLLDAMNSWQLRYVHGVISCLLSRRAKAFRKGRNTRS